MKKKIEKLEDCENEIDVEYYTYFNPCQILIKIILVGIIMGIIWLCGGFE